MVSYKMLFYKETFEEYPILARYKEGDNKDLGFWFIVSSS